MHRLFKTILMLLLNASCYALTLNDNGAINETTVSLVVPVHSETDIIQGIRKAHEAHLPIAIMGKQHSQGAQSLAPNALEFNMLPFNRVLRLDVEKKQITVQSGITWDDLQKYINPFNLAITSMQSPNLFTVGGSMSVNAHGDDFRSGSVGNSIVAFHLIDASGKKILVTPNQEPTLWASVIGGYGLFGVITDVTLQLTDNSFLVGNYKNMLVKQLPNYFKHKILDNKNITFFYGRLNIVPGPHFLKDLYVVTHQNTHQLPDKTVPLHNADQWNFIFTPIFNFSRHNPLGKELRWHLEKIIFRMTYTDKRVTRNNAMEEPDRFALAHAPGHANWLQEYFIPMDQFLTFEDAMRRTLIENKVNLLNATIRYVPAEPNVLLSYSYANCFSIVLYFDQDLSFDTVQHTKYWTQQLIDAALSVGGNYYLPYQNWARADQFKKAYPGYKKIIAAKKKYDPENIFVNRFYQIYFT